MAPISITNYLSTLILLSFFKTLAANKNSLFSFNGFVKDLDFQSSIALYGDAEVVNGSSSVQLTGSGSSAGRMIYKKPIKLFEEGNGRNRNWVSFSTYFTFSITRGNGDGLAFIMLPSGFNAGVFGNNSFGLSLELNKSKIRFVGVEFDTSVDVKYGDLNYNHVGIDVGSLVSVKATNLSYVNLVLNGGKKLHSWIDYEAGSKRLEVRLSQSGELKPVDPLLSCLIDLAKMWKDEEVFVGLTSSNKNSSQKCFVHSWSFKLRRFMQWMHSQPHDPSAFTDTVTVKPKTVEKRSECVARMLAVMVIGTACGALGASVVLYLWTIFGNRRPVVPEGCAVHHVEFEYKKVELVVDKTMDVGKK